MTNVGSGGGAAPAAAAPAGGEAAAPAAEEKKEEGNDNNYLECEDWQGLGGANGFLQRRRSPTRTWALVFSTKRILLYLFSFVVYFLSPFTLDLLVPDITPLHEDRNGKKRRINNGQGHPVGLGALLA